MVGREGVDHGVDEHRGDDGHAPAPHPPDARGGVAQADDAEDVVGQAAADEDAGQRDEGQGDHHEGEGEVVGLLAHESALLVDAVDDVQRPPGCAEGARGAVQRHGQAQYERHAHGSAGALDGPRQRFFHAVDGGRAGAALAQRVGRLGDQLRPAEQSQQRHAGQKGGEERQHHVVREPGRVVGHLVGLEALGRADERAEPHDPRSGSSG